MTVSWPSISQKQLVLVDRGGVADRFQEGDYFRLILKNGKQKEGYIGELSEFSIRFTSRDTVSFNTIRKVRHSKQAGGSLVKTTGNIFIVAGVSYFALDRINHALGYNPGDFEPSVVRTSVILTVAGGILLLVRPRYTRVNNGIYLRTIDYKSPLYRTLN